MNKSFAALVPIIGRILIGGFFLLSGINKSLSFLHFVQIFANTPIPHPVGLALIVIAVEVAIGLALIIDYYTRPVALAACVYVLLSSTSFFSALTATQTQLFLENMALIGALLMLVAYSSVSQNKRA
jgi:putative oxidoreductase